MITVTLLAENTARGAGILGEHGLAWWIDTGAHRVLFDTGQGMVLAHNAAALGIDLARADAIVLSHGHFDHVGGLETALAAAPGAAVWMHPRAIEPKFSGSGGGPTARRIGTAFMEREGFRTAGRRVVASAQPREVVPGLWTTGEIPRTNDFEDTGGPFYLDEAMTCPDPLLDDQAMFFTAREGVVAILGCAHAGVVNTLDHVARLTKRDSIHAVLGGMHLERAAANRLAKTFAAFVRLRVARVAPLHCTGAKAAVALSGALGERCEFAGAGSVWSFAGGGPPAPGDPANPAGRGAADSVSGTSQDGDDP